MLTLQEEIKVNVDKWDTVALVHMMKIRKSEINRTNITIEANRITGTIDKHAYVIRNKLVQEVYLILKSL